MYILPPVDPEEQQPGYEYTVDLGGSEYEIKLRWNDRLERWYFSISDSNGDVMLRNARLTPGRILGDRAPGRSPDGGKLFVWDTDETGDPVGYTDLGSRVLLVWITQDDIDSA